MNASSGDVFEQLESAVANWGAQLEETETRLLDAVAAPEAGGAVAETVQRQVQELRETVESLLAVLNAQRSRGEEGPDEEAYAAAMQARCEALEAEVNALRQEREALRSECDELRRQLDAKPAAVMSKGVDMPAGFAAFDDEGRRRRIGDILRDAKLLSDKQLAEALREQKWTRRRRLGDILIERGVASEVLVGVIVAAQLRLPFENLDDVVVDEAITRRIPAKLALRHNVIPLREVDGRLVVATANPLDLIALDDIELACGMPVQPVVASASAIRTRLGHFFSAEE